MEKLLFRVLRKLLLPRRGRTKFQDLFYQMYLLSLEGMNYGGGREVDNSGEVEVMHYIKQKLPQRPVIFDVGANEGQFAKALLQILGHDIVLYCFEPSIDTFQKLKENIADPAVVLLPFGFSDQRESRALYSTPASSLMNSVYKRQVDHFNLTMQAAEIIELTTLDSFCKENGIGRIDYLKMDVEGHELAILKGAEQLLAKRAIQFIQFEFGGCNIDARTYFQDYWYLLHENYTLYRIVQDGLVPVRKYEEHLEIFELTNFLAEKK